MNQQTMSVFSVKITVKQTNNVSVSVNIIVNVLQCITMYYNAKCAICGSPRVIPRIIGIVMQCQLCSHLRFPKCNTVNNWHCNAMPNIPSAVPQG